MDRVFRGYFELALNKLHDSGLAFEILESARARVVKMDRKNAIIKV